MSAVFMFLALSQIGAPVMAWVAAAVCAAMDLAILCILLNRRY